MSGEEKSLRNSMKKTKPIANAAAFIRKRKEKWRPSLTGSEDIGGDASPDLSSSSSPPPSPLTPLSPKHDGPHEESRDSSMRSLDNTSEGSSISDVSTTIGAAKKLEQYVGFANLPNQVFRKSVNKGKVKIFFIILET